MKVSKATAIETESGRIDLYTNAGIRDSADGELNFWQSLDITAVSRDGREMTVCCVEFDSETGYVLKVFGPTGIDPVFQMPISFDEICRKKYHEVTLG